MPEKTELAPVLRAYRFALDPTNTQLGDLNRHAGAQRWAYNYALARKVDAHQQWREAVAELVAGGTPEAQARKQVKTPIPNATATGTHWRVERGDGPAEIEGVCPWWREVSSYAISTGFRNADVAWKNFIDSRSGKRAGRAVGYPRFKAKGRAADAFTLFHDAKKPTIRPDGYRRLHIPRIGSVRLAYRQGKPETTKHLTRLINKGEAVVKSVTVSRGGTTWYASVLVELTPEAMRLRESRARASAGASKDRQAMRPAVGVEWGVRKFAVLSDETIFENPRIGKQHEKRLRRANRALARKPLTPGQPTSNRRRKALDRLREVHHGIAERRKRRMHQVTTFVALNYPEIALRDLRVQQMTRSAKGTAEAPGRNVKVKARFNRAILDTAPFEFGRQLRYKAEQWGVRVRVAPADLPSSQTCNRCGWRDPSIPLKQEVFRCGNIACGMKLDREVNSARNILHHAVPVASHTGETLNARGESVGPPRRQPSAKREDRPRQRGRPPRGSDPPASLDP